MRTLNFAFARRPKYQNLNRVVSILKREYGSSIEINTSDLKVSSDLEIIGEIDAVAFKRICFICKKLDGYVYSF